MTGYFLSNIRTLVPAVAVLVLMLSLGVALWGQTFSRDAVFWRSLHDDHLNPFTVRESDTGINMGNVYTEAARNCATNAAICYASAAILPFVAVGFVSILMPWMI